jgi:hypothetical protein
MDDTTIDLPEIAPNEQLDTPRKNRILGYIDCCQINGLKWTKVGVAKLYKVHRMQVDYAIKNPHPHTKKNSELKKGNARKITDKDLDAVERFIEETESDSHSVNWYDIVYRLDLNVTGGHLSKVMKPRQIATYMTTEKTLVLAKLAARRVEWCKTMLARYPKKEEPRRSERHSTSQRDSADERRCCQTLALLDVVRVRVQRGSGSLRGDKQYQHQDVAGDLYSASSSALRVRQVESQ